VVGFSVFLTVSFVTEFGEAVYLPTFRLGDRLLEFLGLSLCGWLCHWPYGLCVFVVCV
jgi:hypothetical protein